MIINVNLVSRYIRNCLLCTISVRTEHTMARARARTCVCVSQLVNGSWTTSVSEPKTNFLGDQFVNQLFKLSAGRFVSDNSSTSVRHGRENFWKGGGRPSEITGDTTL